MNALKGWNIISRADLHEMGKFSHKTEDRVKAARFEYRQKRKSCNSDKAKYLLVTKIANEYNVREEVILEYF